MRAAAGCALLVLLVNASLFAQKPSPIELGFKAERVYDFGSVDSVNALNGNAIVNLPLGLSYPVSSTLSYALKLVYNSKVWDYRYIDDEFDPDRTYLWAKPNIRSNAGPGWRVSLGRLLPPQDATMTTYHDNLHPWVYETASGSEHSFHSGVYGGTAGDLNASVQFTVDGSHLRMVVMTPAVRRVEFPDGEFHTFTFERDAWRLIGMEDRFGNTVTVHYLYWSTTDNRVTSWIISDQYNRQHTVAFRYFSDMADSADRGMNADYIDLEGAGGTMRFQFNYQVTAVPFGPYHDAPQEWTGSASSFPLLTDISLPDTTTYTFSYNTALENGSQGLLEQVTLPTRGVIAYSYQTYRFPDQTNPCASEGPRSHSPGVRTRSFDGDIWTHLQTLAPVADTVDPTPDGEFGCPWPEGGTYAGPPPRRWSRTSVLSPADPGGVHTRNDHYFAIWVADESDYRDDRLGAHNWSDFQFGEPITSGWPGAAAAAQAPPLDETVQDQAASDTTDAGRRFLSHQTWSGCTVTGDCTSGSLLRSTYRRYGSFSAEGRTVTSDRTLFHDDSGCVDGQTTCHIQADRSDSDRVGNFRTVVVSSNFSGVTGATTFTNYVARTDSELNSPGTPWMLATYTDVSRTVGGETTKSQFCFESSGLLLRKRTLAGSGPGSHDLVTEYVYSAGNLLEEKSYGGDMQVVDTSQSDLCLTPLEAPQYWNRYAYSNGVLASSEYVDPATGQALPFKTIDYSISPATGLVTASRGTDGLSTSYAYKRWGALESMTPPGEAMAVYTYTPATSTSPARVQMSRADVTATHEYDGLGRLQRTERTLPGAGCAEQVIGYDRLGRKAAETVWKQCGAAGASTLFRYDALGRLVSVSLPDGSTATSRYEGVRVVSRIRRINAGNTAVTAREESDVLGRLVKVTENAGPNGMGSGENTATYGYDAGDRLISVTIPGAGGTQTRAFHYDKRGLLLGERHPELGIDGDGATAYLTYDARGHVRRRATGPLDVSFTYDPAERLTAVFETVPNRKLKEFVYDSYGLCTAPVCSGKLAAAARYHYDPELGDPVVTESYQYHSVNGRPGRKDTVIGLEQSYTFALTQSYDSLGSVATIGYPCPNGWTCRAVTNGYVSGVLSSVTPWATGITYHPGGSVNTVTHGSGTEAVHEIWQPDPNGMARPRKISAVTSGGATLWTSGTYEYDGSGNIIRIGEGDHTTYGYDPYGRLVDWRDTRADGSFHGISRAYDTFGNYLADSIHGCGPGGGTFQPCYMSSVLGAAVVGTTNHYAGYSYDAAGNVVDAGNRTFTYDALGVTTSASDAQIRLRYLYTPEDERIAAVERITGIDGVTRNRVSYTARDFGNRLLSVWTTDPNTGAISWKEDAIWRGAALLARESAAMGSTGYVVDHLGSPRATTSAGGELIGTQHFAPFGSGGTANGGALQFTAQERDAANLGGGTVGLPDYFHARYYSPEKGRFLSVDPHLDVEAAMKQPQRWNRYAYVSNNPINRIDPDGRQEAAAIEAAMISGDTVEEQAEFWSGYREGLGKGMLAASIFAGGLGARSLLSGGVALYRSFQVSNAMRVAAAGTAALSGSNRDMANQAFSMTARLAGSATQKVQYFQSLAAQITRASSGAWNATKMAGPNGSTVFYGKVGEALVIDSKGNVYRGQLNVAVKVVKDTVEIAWDKLRLVQ